jgi:hypothetical protein
MNRPLRGMPVMLSLIAPHISVSSVGKRKRGGITPTTRCGRPSVMIVRPTTAGSPSKSRCQTR